MSPVFNIQVKSDCLGEFAFGSVADFTNGLHVAGNSFGDEGGNNFGWRFSGIPGAANASCRRSASLKSAFFGLPAGLPEMPFGNGFRFW